MAVATKALRNKRKKVLIKQLKAQYRNAQMVAKRIARLKKQLWKIEMEALRETGGFQQLTWQFDSNIDHIDSMGLISKETTKDNKVVADMQKYMWKQEKSYIILHKTTGGDVALSIELESQETGFDERDPMVINIFVRIDYDSKITMAEERVLSDLVLTEFVQKWGIKNIVREVKRET